MTESDRRESERGKYALGAQFIATPDGPMFVYAIDANNVIGPRKATNSDKMEHAGLWAQFEAASDSPRLISARTLTRGEAEEKYPSVQSGEGAADPFDHDHNGKPGGSLPKAKREHHRKA